MYNTLLRGVVDYALPTLTHLINYILPAGARFFQGAANEAPEAEGLSLLSTTIGYTPPSNIISGIAYFDATVQGAILGLSEFGKSLDSSRAVCWHLPSLRNGLFTFITSVVTGVIAFDGEQDFSTSKGASSEASVIIGLAVAAFSMYSVYRFTLDRTERAETLAWWPEEKKQRALFLGRALLGNTSQGLSTFYQLYRFFEKWGLEDRLVYSFAGGLTALFLVNFNQTQVRIMGNRIREGAQNQQTPANLSNCSWLIIKLLGILNYFNVISAAAMLLTLVNLTPLAASTSHPAFLAVVITLGGIAGLNSASLSNTFRLNSVAIFLERADAVVALGYARLSSIQMPCRRERYATMLPRWRDDSSSGSETDALLDGSTRRRSSVVEMPSIS